MPDSPRPRSAFVPHDLAAPIAGVVSGPLAGLMAVVKDMYDIRASAPAVATHMTNHE